MLLSQNVAGNRPAYELVGKVGLDKILSKLTPYFDRKHVILGLPHEAKHFLVFIKLTRLAF